ncbi:hypothetical protein [Butyricicoccus sp.]|jgi:hypothetical protein|uniref:hypothetical protein n=1 Tax=Butyricicoccus TaxID=580596 RepID=UPI003AAD8804
MSRQDKVLTDRKIFHAVGYVCMAAAVVLAVRLAQGNLAWSHAGQGMLPIILQELAAVCLGEYAATRPDTDAWIGRTLKTVLAASVPSLIWAVFWFIR